MISAISLVVALGAQKAPSAFDATLPFGTGTNVYERVLQVEDLLAKKKFLEAKKLGETLPKSVNTYKIDYKNVPASARTSIEQGVSFAIDKWNFALTKVATLVPVKSGSPDILISFEPNLGKKLNENPPAIAMIWGESKPDPVLEAVISMSRGSQGAQTTGVDAFNETLYAVGTYLGLGSLQQNMGATVRVDDTMNAANSILPEEVKIVTQVLGISKGLRNLAISKKPFKVTAPSLFIESRKLNFERTFQGDFADSDLTIANNGNTTLKLQAFGDCGCIKGFSPPELKPGETGTLRGTYNTSELSGDVQHNVVLLTNDPKNPLIKLPAIINVRPRFSAVFPDSDVIDLNQESNEFYFYFTSEEAKIPKIKRMVISGIDIAYRYEPFEGTVKNNFFGEKELKIRGYKVTLNTEKVKNLPVYGRLSASFLVTTDNDRLSEIRPTINVQKGILCIPEMLFMGAPTGPIEQKFYVSRPSADYKITKVESDSKRLSVSVGKKFSIGQYEIVVKYDGKALEHQIKTEIRVFTDDPKQPVVKIKAETSGQ